MTGVFRLGDRVEWTEPSRMYGSPNPTGVLVQMDTGRNRSCARVRWDPPHPRGHHDEDHKSYADLRPAP